MQVVKAPDPVLRIKLRPVKKITPALVNTTQAMVRLTKTFKDPEGVGLAANQVGLKESFFVARADDSKKPNHEAKFITVFNPKITWISKQTRDYFEGCLSIPNIWGEVKRHLSIKVSYQDENGKLVTKTLKGLLAHIFQHEVDHLNGILFTERVLEQKGKFYKYTGKDKTGSDTFEEMII